ncbi:hypothetical protein HYV74_02105 [Candidatus Uhrbacteria bacterium]|nr:hypothetical protein [Candidatus Uhrbacteria bacterium]
MRSADLHRRAEDLRSLARAQGKSPGPADFFEAVRAHEDANGLLAAFRRDLARSETAAGRTVLQLTSDVFRAAVASFGKATALAEAERAALEGYDRADRERWTGQRVSSMDARLLAFDILARRATREPVAEIRTAAQEEVERRLADAIADITEGGRRAEYQLIWLIRRLARLQQRDHCIDIAHSLPRDDMAFGVDAHLVTGDTLFRLNIKSLSEDAYRTEYNDAVIASGQERARDASAVLVVVPFGDLHDAFRAERNAHLTEFRRRLPVLRKKIVAAIACSLPESNRDAMLALTPAAQIGRSSEKGKRLSVQYLERHTDVTTLRRFGVLSMDDRPDVTRMLDLQKRFCAVARDILETVAHFEHPTPELVQKVQQAIG